MRETVDLEEIRRAIRGHRVRNEAEYGLIVKRRGVMGSKPIFAGTRTPVSALSSYVSRGYSTEQILNAFPHLTPADVDAARDHLTATS